MAALSARDTCLFSCVVQAFVNLVSRNIDLLEQSVTNAEKTLDPSALQKMFKVLPGLVCSASMFNNVHFINFLLKAKDQQNNQHALELATPRYIFNVRLFPANVYQQP